MKQRWLDLTLQRPWLVLLLGILFVFAAGFGGKICIFVATIACFLNRTIPNVLPTKKCRTCSAKTKMPLLSHLTRECVYHRNPFAG